MTDAKVFIGFPVEFEELCEIYPPTVGEVLGMKDFQKYRSVLTMTIEDIEDAIFPTQEIDPKIEVPTPFENLMRCCKADKAYKKVVQDAIYYFTHKKVSVDTEEKIIIIGDTETILSLTEISELPIIDENNYFEFQNIIRACLGENPKEKNKLEKNTRLRKMKAKARYRDRVKAKQGNGITLEDSMTSICCMGIGINPLNIREMSYASMNKLMSKFQQKERYDIDIRSLIAGADAKKVKPQYWMNKLQEK